MLSMVFATGDFYQRTVAYRRGIVGSCGIGGLAPKPLRPTLSPRPCKNASPPDRCCGASVGDPLFARAWVLRSSAEPRGRLRATFTDSCAPPASLTVFRNDE